MRPNFSLPGLLCPRKSVLPQPGGFGRKSVEWTSRSHGARQNHHGGGQTRPSSPSTGSHAARPSDSIEFLVGLVRAQGPLPPPPCGGFSFRRSRPLGQRLRRQSHSNRRGMGVRGWRPQKPWPVAFCASTRHLFPPHRAPCAPQAPPAPWASAEVALSPLTQFRVDLHPSTASIFGRFQIPELLAKLRVEMGPSSGSALRRKSSRSQPKLNVHF